MSLIYYYDFIAAFCAVFVRNNIVVFLRILNVCKRNVYCADINSLLVEALYGVVCSSTRDNLLSTY